VVANVTYYYLVEGLSASGQLSPPSNQAAARALAATGGTTGTTGTPTGGTLSPDVALATGTGANGGATERWLNRVYVDLLHRSIDANALVHWGSSILQRGADPVGQTGLGNDLALGMSRDRVTLAILSMPRLGKS